MTYAELLQLQSELIWVDEFEVATRHLSLSKHYPGLSVLLMRKGNVTVSNDRHEVKAGEGDWIFIREGDRHHRFTEGSRVLSIRFKLGWSGGVPLFDLDPAVVVRGADYPELEVKAKRLYDEAEAQATYGTGLHGKRLQWSRMSLISHCLIKSTFLSFIADCIRVQVEAGMTPTLIRKLDARVRQMKAYLDERGFQKPFRQAELAGKTGLSVSQLDRLFKKEMGMTPHHYQEQRRLEHAFIRLRHSGDSIKEIAFDLGFASPSHFAAWLRRKTHLAPSEVRGDNEGAEFLPH